MKDSDNGGVLQRVRLAAAWCVLWDQGSSALCTSVLERGEKTQESWLRFSFSYFLF